MVRKCIVTDCPHSDVTILCHRFPRRQDNAITWMNALGITGIPILELMNKYTVCTKHFKSTDYRNVMSNFLNLTACPTMDAPEEDAIVRLPSSPPTSTEIVLKRIPKDVVLQRPIKPVPTVSNTQSKSHFVIEVNPSVEPDDLIENDIEIHDNQENHPNILKKKKRIKTDSLAEPYEVIEIAEDIDETDETDDVIVSPTTSSGKRKRLAKSQVLIINSQGVQTDCDMDDVEIKRNYGQFQNMSKLEMAKGLKERDEKIAELTKKCEKLKQIIQDW